MQASLVDSTSSILGLENQAWFRVPDSVTPGQWVALDLGLPARAISYDRTTVDVVEADGTPVAVQTQQVGTDPSRWAWQAQPGQLIAVVTNSGTYRLEPGGDLLPIVARAQLSSLPNVPDPPSHVSIANVGTDTVWLEWWLPLWPGTSPVTSYTVTAAPGGAKCVTSVTHCSIRLDARIAHTFTVTATNVSGTSAPSAPSASVRYQDPYVPPAPVIPAPAAPGKVTAKPHVADLDVAWTAPAPRPGQTPITAYRVTVDGKHVAVLTATARTYRVLAVTGNAPTTHTVSLAARNYGDKWQYGAARTIKVAVPGVVSATLLPRGSKLYVNASPNRSKGHWKFTLQRKSKSGKWVSVGTYVTRGTGQTRTVKPRRKGVYRVRMLDRYGYLGVTTRDYVRLA